MNLRKTLTAKPKGYRSSILQNNVLYKVTNSNTYSKVKSPSKDFLVQVQGAPPEAIFKMRALEESVNPAKEKRMVT